ncbi:hypothetical protein [Rhizobium sp.]
MAVKIKIEGGFFDKSTLNDCLRSLRLREFLDNDGNELLYAGGKYKIAMSGEIAAAPGEEPRDWDLNNTQINEMTFSHGSKALKITGLAMDLREIYRSRSIDDLRDWNDFSMRQDYIIAGSGKNDLIRTSFDGNTDISGHGGNDRLVSLGNNDRLFGGAGNDTLVARGDRAELWGGGGSDKFVIRNTDSDVRIMDFQPGRDQISFGTAIDKLLRGNDGIDGRLRFIGDRDFGGGNHELRADIRRVGGETVTIIELSLRGHEYQIAELKGAFDLGWQDFLL